MNRQLHTVQVYSCRFISESRSLMPTLEEESKGNTMKHFLLFNTEIGNFYGKHGVRKKCGHFKRTDSIYNPRKDR